MLVSVIIPVYNSEPFLYRLFDCLTSQNYKEVEYLFVNDASSDESERLIRSLLPSLSSGRIINSSVNKGAGFSRNVGIANSFGEYVLFVDADDILPPDSIERLVKNALAFNCPDVIIGEASCPDYHYDFGDELFLVGNPVIREKYFRHSWYEMPWNKLIKKEFLLKNHLTFDENIYSEDTVWSLRVSLKAETVLLVPGISYYYQYQHSDSQKTAEKDIIQAVNHRLQLFERIQDVVAEDGNDNLARLYLLDISTSYIISVIQNPLIPRDLVPTVYSQIRKLATRQDAFRGLFHSYLSFGMKISCLYRCFPSTIGYLFLKAIAKATDDPQDTRT